MKKTKNKTSAFGKYGRWGLGFVFYGGIILFFYFQFTNDESSEFVTFLMLVIFWGAYYWGRSEGVHHEQNYGHERFYKDEED